MKMAKATDKDIEAAGAAMSILSNLDYYPAAEGEDDAPMYFDDQDAAHLRRFYERMKATVDMAPGWPVRVIGGMCFVIMFKNNEITNPDVDTLELHPRFAKTAAELEAVTAQRDKLLKPCQDLIAYLDKNPPMGESIYAVRQIREAVASIVPPAKESLADQRIPENCGSGHCSCIECLAPGPVVVHLPADDTEGGAL